MNFSVTYAVNEVGSVCENHNKFDAYHSAGVVSTLLLAHNLMGTPL